MTWRKEAIREVSLALEMAKNVVSVPHIKATLPGDMTVQGGGTPDGTSASAVASCARRWPGSASMLPPFPRTACRV